VDSLDSQKKFTEQQNFPYPLLADEDKKAAKEFGVLNDKGNFALRTTFIIDKKGIIRKIYRNANAEKNPEETLNWVKENLKDSK
jgi:peroxiredoxin Q/BCP